LSIEGGTAERTGAGEAEEEASDEVGGADGDLLVGGGREGGRESDDAKEAK
jgi:hypothetical protein